MSLETKYKPKRGCWFTEHGRTFWKEFLDHSGNQYKLYSPLEIEGISKTAEFNIIFITENNDPESLTGKTKKFWKQDVEVKLAENISQNVYLKTVDKKIFVCDLEPLGQTFICPLESQNWGLIVNKTQPESISQIEAKKLLDNGAMGFGKVEVSHSGIEYYRTC